MRKGAEGSDEGGGAHDAAEAGGGAAGSPHRLPGAGPLAAAASLSSLGAARTVSAPAGGGGVGGVLSRLGAIVTGSAAPAGGSGSLASPSHVPASRRGQWVARAVAAAARRTATVAGFGGDGDGGAAARGRGALFDALFFAPTSGGKRSGSPGSSPPPSPPASRAAAARRRRRRAAEEPGGAFAASGARRAAAKEPRRVPAAAMVALRSAALFRRLGAGTRGGVGASLKEAVVSLWSHDPSKEDLSAPWDGALPGFSDAGAAAADGGARARRDRRLARDARRALRRKVRAPPAAGAEADGREDQALLAPEAPSPAAAALPSPPLSSPHIVGVRLPSVPAQQAAAEELEGEEAVKAQRGSASEADGEGKDAAASLSAPAPDGAFPTQALATARPPASSALLGLPPLPSRPAPAPVPRPLPRPIVLEFSHVTFSPPGASPAAQPLAVDLSLRVRLGDRVLVVGRSGAGKSSLLRVAAGLWTQGSGTVKRLDRAEAFFIPQVPFMPQGSLRDQLLFPRVADGGPRASRAFAALPGPALRVGGVAIEVPRVRDALLHGSRARALDQLASLPRDGARSEPGPAALVSGATLPGSPGAVSAVPTDAELLSLLSLIGLSHLAQRHGGLDAEADWPRELSPGEQQRIAIGRALARGGARGGLQLALLDEASAALDAAWEGKLYALLCEASGAMVSVGHRMELVRYHTHVLQAKGDGQWKLWEAREYARVAGVQPAAE